MSWCRNLFPKISSDCHHRRMERLCLEMLGFDWLHLQTYDNPCGWEPADMWTFSEEALNLFIVRQTASIGCVICLVHSGQHFWIELDASLFGCLSSPSRRSPMWNAQPGGCLRAVSRQSRVLHWTVSLGHRAEDHLQFGCAKWCLLQVTVSLVPSMHISLATRAGIFAIWNGVFYFFESAHGTAQCPFTLTKLWTLAKKVNEIGLNQTASCCIQSRIPYILYQGTIYYIHTPLAQVDTSLASYTNLNPFVHSQIFVFWLSWLRSPLTASGADVFFMPATRFLPRLASSIGTQLVIVRLLLRIAWILSERVSLQFETHSSVSGAFREVKP